MDKTYELEAEEAARIAAVHRYEILDTPPDGTFDRITRLATQLFDVPISIISIVDEDRIWFKSAYGVDATQVDRDPGLCASAVLQGEAWVVSDASTDPRTLVNPLVAGDLGLQFYAGIPLVTADGYRLGVFNIIDVAPRELTEQELDALRSLAAIVMDELELRLAARRVLAKARNDTKRAMGISDSVVARLITADEAIREGNLKKATKTIDKALQASQRAVVSLLEDAADQVRSAEGSKVAGRLPADTRKG